MKIKNAEGAVFDKKIDQYFPPLKLDARLIPIKKQYKIDIDLEEKEQVISFNFINELTKKKVEKRHMYYNKSSKKFISNISLDLDEEVFIKDKKFKTLTVKTGYIQLKKILLHPMAIKWYWNPE